MSKGKQTRLKIIERAAQKAAAEGLGQLTIGSLAEDTGLSKSGLFVHFGSKTALQMAVLEFYTSSFKDSVVQPALREKGGLGKLEKLVEMAQEWDAHIYSDSGCPIIAASTELDDQPGDLREFLKDQQAAYIQLIESLALRAIREGDFRKGLDVRQFAFEIYSHYLGFNFYRRMLEAKDADQRLRNAHKNIIDHARSR
jgi:AcrR family transcriptional regulator